MKLFKNLQLIETQQRAAKEVEHTIAVINEVYNEFKKRKRRKNAVDIITSSINRISNIDPSILDHVHEAAKLKLCTILMRCMDIPPWKDINSKAKNYRRLYPLISKLEGIEPNTGTSGNLREVIMSRLSAAICHQDECERKVFIGYEPKLGRRYLRHLFGDQVPEKTYRMESLPLPDDYDSLIEVLKINHEKGRNRYDNI